MPSLKLTSTTSGSLDSVRFGAPATCSVAPTTDDDLANKKYVDDSVDAIDVANSTFSQPIMQTLFTANGSNKSNTALGENSLSNYYSNDIGPNNTSIGVNSLNSNTSGKDNTSIGYQSLSSNISGDNNTAIGYNTLQSTTNSYHNTAVGKNSLIALRNGANFNTAIGYDSGGNSNTWNGDAYGNTFLGAATYMTNNYTYSTAVGATAAITKSNQIVLGTSAQTVTIPKFTTAGVVHNLANGDLTSSLIVTADISNNAITSEKILNGTILGSDISSNTITDDNIANGTITSFKIATGTIVGTNIATATITSEKILDGTILGSDISSNTITADNIANGAITSDKIGTGVIVGSNISSNTITAGLLANDISYNGLLKVRDCSGGVDTQAANKKYVDDQITEIKGGIPQIDVDTLKEIADKLVDASGTEIYARLASPTFTGTVSGITAAMVSLGNVTNTSDADKPVSTAQQTALDLKANLASPVFTGNPTAPTPDTSDNDTTVATTAFVKNQNYITNSSLGVMPVTEPELGSTVNGSFWFNPTTGNLRIYYGSTWRDFGPLT